MGPYSSREAVGDTRAVAVRYASAVNDVTFTQSRLLAEHVWLPEPRVAATCV